MPASDYQEARSIAGLPFPQPSSFFRRSAYNAFGPLNENLHYGMDYEFFLQIFLNREALCTDEIFSRYRYHKNSKSVSQNAKFAEDYAYVFSKFLNSISEGENWKKWLAERGLWRETGEDAFFVERSFKEDFLRETIFFNLYNRLIFLYEALETKQVRKICESMHEISPELFEKFEELAKIRERTKWLPAGVIGLMRKVSRK
jgi:hypothetical protein